MFDSYYMKSQLDEVESSMDQVVIASKKVMETLEQAQSTIALLSMNDVSGTIPEAIWKLTEAMRLGNEVQLDNAFSVRQLLWAYRPNL